MGVSGLSGPRYEFLLAGTPAGPADAEAAWASIRPGYEVVPGAARQVGRTWLDTFDGRLRAAGLSLACLSGSGAVQSAAGAGTRNGHRGAAGELVLSGAVGEPLRQPVTARWPSLLDALPPGPVAERLRPVVGVRALLPLARVRSSVREWRILNPDEKTVVRAYLDQATVAPGANGGLPARISLLPVRGYQVQAARVARLMAAVAGVAADPPTELDLLLAAGPVPVAATAAPVRPDQDAAGALAGLLLGLLESAELNLPGAIGDVDTEFLHDLRVAVRRTRSALKLAGDVLPANATERFAPEFRWLGELTTPVRDLDTFLLGFDAIAAELAVADPADLLPLREHLRRRRATERRRLQRGLRSSRLTELAAGWRAVLTPLAQPDARAGRRAAAGPPTAAALARDRIAVSWRRVARRAAAINRGSPPAALHDLRKRCKELRYVLELFGTLCHPQPYRALVGELKAVQDSLGAFQDAEVHRDKVRAYAVQMLAAGRAEASTLLAMGELVACFGAAQRRAADQSVIRVSGLAAEANRRRVAGLVSPV